MREDGILYGELVVLGTDGELPNGNRGRRRSRFQLRKRSRANGVRPVSQETISTQTQKSSLFIVRYETDGQTDMFQVGRSTEPPIDMVLIDIQPGQSGQQGSRTVLPEQSTLSRFGCRIVCQREPPYEARIYAAGFDSTNRIFLGERAPKWDRKNLMDGLTTNGVLIRAPDEDWSELSVCGDVYKLRATRSHAEKGEFCPEFDNVLRDGTLIDLCGATLLWRSASSIKTRPKSEDIELSLARLNGQRVQCPVGLSTLNFRHREEPDSKQPFVYLKCGHVHGKVDWGDTEGIFYNL